MAEKTTYIRVDRNITRWRWYTDANTFRVFMHLLLTANHKDVEYKGMVIKSGQVLSSRSKLAKELEMTEANIRGAINRLKLTNELTNLQCGNNTLFTLTNYDYYQTNSPTYSPTSNQPLTNLQEKERKKEKRSKKEIKERIKNIQTGEAEGGVGETKDFAYVKNLFNTTCTTFAKVIVLTNERKRLISKLLDSYSLEEIQQAFQNAEQSSFLKGKKGKWKASFDWLIDEEHFARLLEGNYNDEQTNRSQSFNDDEFFEAALKNAYRSLT